MKNFHDKNNFPSKIDDICKINFKFNIKNFDKNIKKFNKYKMKVFNNWKVNIFYIILIYFSFIFNSKPNLIYYTIFNFCIKKNFSNSANKWKSYKK